MKRFLLALTLFGTALSFQSCGYMLTAMLNDNDDNYYSSPERSSWNNNSYSRSESSRSRTSTRSSGSRSNSLCP